MPTQLAECRLLRQGDKVIVGDFRTLLAHARPLRRRGVGKAPESKPRPGRFIRQ
jgi:hypothetical protein